MNFKKYMVLSVDYVGKYRPYEKINIQIKNGMTNLMLKEELTDDWEPDKKDRLYFFPGCAVPRFKVREKFNTTIKPEYATAAFISSHGLKASDTMFDVINQSHLIDGEYISNWLEFIYGEKHHFVIKFKSLLINCEDDVVIDKLSMYKLKYGCPSNAYYDPKSISNWRSYAFGESGSLNIPGEDQELSFYSPVVNSVLDKLDCPIYSQDAIIKLLNEDNIVIDQKKYEELRLMANSSDEENIILVMELMANANYKKSFVYLLLLLKEFNSQITARSKEISHVNFKALLNFLDLDEKKINHISIEQLTAGMKKHKQFTRANVQRVTQYFAAGEEPGTHPNTGITNTSHFTTGPVLRKEMEDQLDDYAIVDDVEIETDDISNFNL
jgi:hypothetical protein